MPPGMTCEKPMKRERTGGRAPPTCGIIKRISGQRKMVPLKKRFVTARAVSKKNSYIGRGCWEASGVALITSGDDAVPDESQAMQGLVG